jgi:hypothetical protein
MNNKKQVLKETYKRQRLAGIISESKYDDLIAQIAVDYQGQLDYERERDETYLLENEKFAKKAAPKRGKMKKILDIPEDEKVSDHYKSGKALANALMGKLNNQKEVTGMLAFAANVNKEEDVFDKALSYMKKIEESSKIDETDFLI